MAELLPEIPEVEQALIPLAEKAGPWFFRIGMAGLLADFLLAAGKHIPHWIPYVGSALESAGHAIEHEVQLQKSAEALSAMPGLVRFTVGMAHVFEDQAIATFDLAQNTFGAFEVLTGHTIPHASRAAAAQAATQAAHAKAIARDAAHAERTASTRLAHRAMTIAATADAALALGARALHKAEAIALPRSLPWVVKGIDDVRSDVWKLAHRVYSLPKWLTVAGVSAVAIGALNIVGGSWIRCRNWKRIGRAGCRLPTSWLNDLLALVADFVIVTNICAVIPWLETAFSEVASPLVAALTKAGAGLCAGGAGAPELLPPPTLYLPASPEPTLYLP